MKGTDLRKLTAADVLEIRRLYVPAAGRPRNHPCSAVNLGRRFHVTKNTISDIVHRKIWSHL